MGRVHGGPGRWAGHADAGDACPGKGTERETAGVRPVPPLPQLTAQRGGLAHKPPWPAFRVGQPGGAPLGPGRRDAGQTGQSTCLREPGHAHGDGSRHSSPRATQETALGALLPLQPRELSVGEAGIRLGPEAQRSRATGQGRAHCAVKATSEGEPGGSPVHLPPWSAWPPEQGPRSLRAGTASPLLAWGPRWSH